MIQFFFALYYYVKLRLKNIFKNISFSNHLGVIYESIKQ